MLVNTVESSQACWHWVPHPGLSSDRSERRFVHQRSCAASGELCVCGITARRSGLSQYVRARFSPALWRCRLLYWVAPIGHSSANDMPPGALHLVHALRAAGNLCAPLYAPSINSTSSWAAGASRLTALQLPPFLLAKITTSCHPPQ